MLEGEYDWFYEGFTLYQALRTGVRLRMFSFQEYLDAVARAYDAYLRTPNRTALSLVGASRERWNGATSLVYNKGMLVAFLYDLTIREQTNGRRSLDDVYRNLYGSYNSSKKKMNGNAAVIKTLRELNPVSSSTQRFIEGAEQLDLATQVAPFGLKVELTPAGAHITTSAALSKAQRNLLRELGYTGK